MDDKRGNTKNAKGEPRRHRAIDRQPHRDVEPTVTNTVIPAA